MKLNNSLFFEFKKQLLEKIASVPLDEIKYLFNLVKKVKGQKKKNFNIW